MASATIPDSRILFRGFGSEVQKRSVVRVRNLLADRSAEQPSTGYPAQGNLGSTQSPTRLGPVIAALWPKSGPLWYAPDKAATSDESPPCRGALARDSIPIRN
jgi:hypothetical protein